MTMPEPASDRPRRAPVLVRVPTLLSQLKPFAHASFEDDAPDAREAVLAPFPRNDDEAP